MARETPFHRRSCCHQSSSEGTRKSNVRPQHEAAGRPGSAGRPSKPTTAVTRRTPQKQFEGVKKELLALGTESSKLASECQKLDDLKAKQARHGQAAFSFRQQRQQPQRPPFTTPGATTWTDCVKRLSSTVVWKSFTNSWLATTTKSEALQKGRTAAELQQAQLLAEVRELANASTATVAQRGCSSTKVV